MSRLFKRALELRVEQPTVGDYGQDQVTTTTITNHRVRFSTERHLGKKPNSCEITIFNTSEETRAAFMTKPARIRLFAGYEDSVQRLFVGDLIFGRSSNPTGVTWQTVLQLGDGQRSYKHGRSSRSFKAGTSIKTVLGDVAKTMGLKVPSSVDEAVEFAKQFTTGVTISDPSHRELSRLVRSAGHDWSIQNGELQILRDRDNNPVQAHRVAVDTGMIGIPEMGAPTKAKKKPVLSVRMKMAGHIKPGDPIDLETEVISGRFKVQRINDVGDTEGTEWYSSIEAT